MKSISQTLSFTLLVSVALSPYAYSHTPPQAPAQAATCDGLQSSAGKFSDNHKKRQHLNKKLCEKGGLKKVVDGIRAKLKPCEDLGTDLKGKNHGINVDIFFPDVQNRIVKACQVHDHYDKTAQALCVQYGETAESTRKAATADRAIAHGSGQAGDFNQIAGLHAAAVPKYKLYAASMRSMGNQINKEMPGMKDSVDTQMAETIRRLRYQIQALTKAKREQISKKYNERIAVAGSQGDESAMRLRTEADVKRFWTNIVKCEAVAKDNGNLDKFNKTYQGTMAKSISVAMQESADLAKKFDAQASEHMRAQKSAEASSQALGRTNSPSEGMRALATSSGPLPKPVAASSVARGDSLVKAHNGDTEAAIAQLRAGSLGRRLVESQRVTHEGVTYRVFHRPSSRGTQEYYIPVR